MLEAVELRFGASQPPHSVEWLSHRETTLDLAAW
jgi:hypothetical protein